MFRRSPVAKVEIPVVTGIKEVDECLFAAKQPDIIKKRPELEKAIIPAVRDAINTMIDVGTYSLSQIADMSPYISIPIVKTIINELLAESQQRLQSYDIPLTQAQQDNIAKQLDTILWSSKTAAKDYNALLEKILVDIETSNINIHQHIYDRVSKNLVRDLISNYLYLCAAKFTYARTDEMHLKKNELLYKGWLTQQARWQFEQPYKMLAITANTFQVPTELRRKYQELIVWMHTLYTHVYNAIPAQSKLADGTVKRLANGDYPTIDEEDDTCRKWKNGLTKLAMAELSLEIIKKLTTKVKVARRVGVTIEGSDGASMCTASVVIDMQSEEQARTEQAHEEEVVREQVLEDAPASASASAPSESESVPLLTAAAVTKASAQASQQFMHNLSASLFGGRAAVTTSAVTPAFPALAIRTDSNGISFAAQLAKLPNNATDDAKFLHLAQTLTKCKLSTEQQLRLSFLPHRTIECLDKYLKKNWVGASAHAKVVSAELAVLSNHPQDDVVFFIQSLIKLQGTLKYENSKTIFPAVTELLKTVYDLLKIVDEPQNEERAVVSFGRN